MKFLSLFSGIGGLDLGLERAAMTCVGQVDIDPFCRAVLAKHWPDVPRMENVRDVSGDEFGPVDLVCGGVPCQPASCAGKRKGSDDDRWLWPEFARIVRATRCSWFLAENVRGFLSLPVAGGVIRDLEGAGYEVRTVLLGAHHVGAPHRRDRIWIVGRLADASRDESKRRGRPGHVGSETAAGVGNEEEWERVRDTVGDRGSAVANAISERRRSGSGEQGNEGHERRGRIESGIGSAMADTQSTRCEGDDPAGYARTEGRFAEHGGTRWPSRPGEPQHEWEAPRLVYAQCAGRARPHEAGRETQRRESIAGTGGSKQDNGLAEPRLGIATPGLPRRLAGFARGITGWPDAQIETWWRRNRVRLPGYARRSGLKALGNAVVPQVAEVIGRAIMESQVSA